MAFIFTDRSQQKYTNDKLILSEVASSHRKH